MTAISRNTRFGILVGLSALLLSAAGCSRAYYREWADKEVYRIVERKQKTALDEEGGFSIEPCGLNLLASLPRKFQPLLPESAGADLGEDIALAEPSEPPAVVSLNKAIEIALCDSRDYQRNKEDLYLAALALTGDRHLWTPRFKALLSGEWRHDDSDESWAGNGSFGVSQLLATGGSLALDFSTNLLRFATGDPREAAASTVSATLIQPLWRGAGRRVARENLRQSERDVIYEVRSFARYHRTFAVSIATTYLRTLEQRDRVKNAWNDYQRRVESRRRAEDMAKAGRLPEFEVDQSKQEELTARNSLVSELQGYSDRLDEFKVDLGLPTDVNLDVDEEDLAALSAAGIVHPDISSEAAVRQALALRLDLMNTGDAVDDAARKVDVEADGLLPSVDLTLAAASGTVNNQPANVQFNHAEYSAGLDVDPALDRKLERNSLRRAQITLDRARRAYIDLRDGITLDVRQAWRTLQERRESYDIQRKSLALAESRVESTSLLLQAGRATTRDLIDSQSALLQAQNALLGALVDHTIARLELWRDMETLLVTPEGSLEEKSRERES
jgi:outer membrane protein TolC